MKTPAFRLVAIAVGLVLAASTAHAQTRAEVGKALTLTVTSEPFVIELPSIGGDYVTGSFEADIPVTVDLLNAAGGHVRRLVTGAAGATEFHFISPDDRASLHVKGANARILLRLSRVVSQPADIATSAEIISPAMLALQDRLAHGGNTAAFWKEVEARGTPLVEPAELPAYSIVTFLARGASDNVLLFGAPSGDHDALSKLGDSDVWYRSYLLPNQTRLAYQLAVDVPKVPGTARERRVAILATAKSDPFNRNPWPVDAVDEFNREFVLELPEAPPQLGLENKGAARGTLTSFEFASEKLGNKRTITIYRPAGWQPSDVSTRFLFLFDAQKYLSTVPTPLILDNLIAEKRIPPVVAVFVSEIDRKTRGLELPANETFADFMAYELLPRIETELGAAIPPERAILAGSSYGGLAAATVALRHPGMFGNAISMSGSFWWHPEGTAPEDQEYVAGLLAGSPRKAVRFFVTAGLFETGRPDSPGILDTSRHLRDVLRAKGYDFDYREYAGGHDYLVWGGALADALIEITK
ncbi:MAG: alpha/beta hydrolase-fold protein [Mesorhizobium sp.]